MEYATEVAECCVCCGERGGIAEVIRTRRRNDFRFCGVPVAESVLAPPGPIPNPVVTRYSAGEYCSGNAVGGEAAAGAPQDLRLLWECRIAGWSSGSSLGS